uniref:response regulator n=1 Tax=Clostridium sp. NkU-1 TaxID=1095009 RepID=UPI0006CF8448
MKILIAEDELAMQKILKLYFENAGYEVDVASDGEGAFDKLCQNKYDLLIADWMMPKMNGIQLCEEIRSYSLPIKIIMLTAKSEIENEITGLSCGADDYIRKPFEPKILLLRVQKLLQMENILQCGDLSVNIKNQTIYKGPEEIRLTQKEFQLLQFFLQNKGITLTRDSLLQRVWGDEYNGDERTLDTHIRRLRSKIGKEYITTFVGTGYRMSEPNE